MAFGTRTAAAASPATTSPRSCPREYVRNRRASGTTTGSRTRSMPARSATVIRAGRAAGQGALRAASRPCRRAGRYLPQVPTGRPHRGGFDRTGRQEQQSAQRELQARQHRARSRKTAVTANRVVVERSGQPNEAGEDGDDAQQAQNRIRREEVGEQEAQQHDDSSRDPEERGREGFTTVRSAGGPSCDSLHRLVLVQVDLDLVVCRGQV